jgi:hypothetical protein
MKHHGSPCHSSAEQTVTVAPHCPVRKIAVLAPGLGVLLIFSILAAITIFDFRGAFAQEGEPVAPQAMASFTSAGTLSFQGELRDASTGNPLADGDYRMRFAIYDAESGGSRRWPAPSPDYEEHTAVSVTDGLFNVLLGSHITIPGSVFGDGGDRYLQIWVCPNAGIGCTAFEDLGRLPIASVGYAKSLAPGAAVSGSGTILSLSSTATEGGVLSVNASAASGNAAAVYAQSSAASGAGLSGYNSAGGVGVYGASQGGTAVFGTAPTLGVMGNATAASGVAYGVKGQNASYNGAGVYGASSYASGTGVKGESSAGAGVYGVSTSGNGASGQSSSGAGLWGFSVSGDGVAGTSTGGDGVAGTSTGGAGVRGTSTISGTVGIATRNTGTNYGVYGQNASAKGAGVYGASTHPDGYGLYSDGDAHVEGDLTWQPVTGYISVPAAAFQPRDNSINYRNDGYTVYHIGSVSEKVAYFAPVALPLQADLKGLAVTVCNSRGDVTAGYNIELRLLRFDTTVTDPAAGPTEIAAILPGSQSGHSCVKYATSSFEDAVVDNSRYVYYLGAWTIGTQLEDLPYTGINGVIIEYEVSRPY